MENKNSGCGGKIMAKPEILIVEDSKLQALDLKNKLIKLRYKVCGIIATGRGAIKKSKDLSPDLVLMDIILKGKMDGIKAAKHIHSKFDIPVIYLTSSRDDKTFQRAKVTEPYGYILKPINERELHINIEIALTHHRIEKELREEKALREKGEKFRELADSLPETIFEMDIKGNVTFVNRTTTQMFGYTLNDFTSGMDSLEVLIPGDGDRAGKNLRKTLSGIACSPTEYNGLRKDGSTLPVIIHAHPIMEGRKCVGTRGLIIDITRRKEAERSLAAEKERLDVTLRSIGDGVITTDNKGKITLMNKVAEKLTGWSQEDSIGKPLNKVFHIINENTREHCEDPVKKVIKTGGIVGLANHTVLIAKDRTERVLADSGSPIRDKEGRIIGVVLVFRDITEKRKIEEEHIKSSRLESLGILAGGIAHDFNNLLTAVIGNISLAKMSLDPKEEIFEILIDAERAARKTTALTKQLSTFSKGGAPIKKVSSISELIKDTVKFVLRGSNVKCKFQIPDNLWLAEVDEGQFSQVINNLVINAMQSMPDGGIVEIYTENTVIKPEKTVPLQDGEYIKITVKDQGIGIPREHQQKIFDPYFTTKQKGSGLGLTTSYSIIKQHDGYISLESDVGEGTTFFIYLPASGKKIRIEKKTTIGPIKGKGRILLMDDKEVVRKSGCKMIKQLGYEIKSAIDGKEAINLYKKAKESGQPFDVVILDLTIPGGMGGKEAVGELKKIDPKVKAIVSSGYSNDPVMSDFKKYGFKGVLPKPYEIEELSEILNKVIN